MVGYPYQYGDELTQEQANQEYQKFGLGFSTAAAIFGIYKLAGPAIAYAADKKPPSPNDVCPVPAPAADKEVAKEFTAGVLAVLCGTAVTSGAFWMGLACGALVLGAGKFFK